MDRRNRPLVVMVLLREPAMPDPEAIASCLESRCGERYHVRWDGPVEGQADHSRIFTVNGQSVKMGLIPGPVPQAAWEAACARNAFWPEGTEVCRQHRAHLIVAFQGDWGDPIRRHLLLTDFVAALSEAADALAVLWGPLGVIQPAEYFREHAAQASTDDLPLQLWVNFILMRDADKQFVVTSGLDAFGVREVEGSSSRMQPFDLVGRVFDAAYYLCTHGPVMNDGDTFGCSDAEQIPVRHTNSVLDRPGPVIRLDFDGARRGLLSRLLSRR